MNSKSDITEVLRKRKIPLDLFAIADSASGRLYTAEGTTLNSILDPLTLDPVVIDPDVQTYIGSVENRTQVFHTVFMNEDGKLVDYGGSEFIIEQQNSTTWLSAILDITFPGQ